MQQDIASKMLDRDGNLKPFSKFAQDVQSITDHQCKQWLRTEYDTAVLRAHLAAEYKQFEAEKDVYPNIEWTPTTLHTPGEDHRPFWGVVRPVGDRFWSEHHPSDRWNCKCGWEQTDSKEKHTPYRARQQPRHRRADIRRQSSVLPQKLCRVPPKQRTHKTKGKRLLRLLPRRRATQHRRRLQKGKRV